MIYLDWDWTWLCKKDKGIRWSFNFTWTFVTLISEFGSTDQRRGDI